MTLSDWMTSVIRPGPFNPPGMVVAINDAIEVCGVNGAGLPITAESLWPLSCVTKLAIADLAARTLFLDAPITTWLPEVETPATVRALLTHTAGLPLDLPCELYGKLDAEGVRRTTLATRLMLQPGRVSYSNIGYGWVVYALERATGQSLADLWAAYDLISSVDVTEAVTITDIRSPHAGTSIEPVNSAYWRSLALPWCGAFATVRAVRHLIDRLDPGVYAARAQAPGGFPQGAYLGFSENGGCTWEDAAWSCGVEHRGKKTPHWITSSASPESFGHMGNSGLLAWKDGPTTLVIAGARTTDGGWMLRHGPRASAFAFKRAPNDGGS
jgi:CubicO group peptidase (beta-lactamase class C family)